MPDPAAAPPPIPQEIFYRSIRTYRNMRTVRMLACAVVIGTPFAMGLFAHLMHPDQNPGNMPVPILYFVTGLFTLSSCIYLSNMIRNVREPIEINSAGVRWKHNYWYWPQVKSLEPKKVNFATKYFLRVNLHVDPRACLLEPDAPFTPRQYAEFVARLQPFLAARYPAVQVKGLP